MKFPLAPGFKFLFLVLALALSAACAPKSAPSDAGAAPSAAAGAPAPSSGGETAMPAANGQNDPFPVCGGPAAMGASPQDITGTYTVSGEDWSDPSKYTTIPPYTGELTITKIQEYCFHMVWVTDGPKRIATVTVRKDGIVTGDWIEGSETGMVSGSIEGDRGSFQLSYASDDRFLSEEFTRK